MSYHTAPLLRRKLPSGYDVGSHWTVTGRKKPHLYRPIIKWGIVHFFFFLRCYNLCHVASEKAEKRLEMQTLHYSINIPFRWHQSPAPHSLLSHARRRRPWPRESSPPWWVVDKKKRAVASRRRQPECIFRNLHFSHYKTVSAEWANTCQGSIRIHALPGEMKAGGRDGGDERKGQGEEKVVGWMCKLDGLKVSEFKTTSCLLMHACYTAKAILIYQHNCLPYSLTNTHTHRVFFYASAAFNGARLMCSQCREREGEKKKKKAFSARFHSVVFHFWPQTKEKWLPVF